MRGVWLVTVEKIFRLPFQALALLLQLYFIIETIRLYICGYVVYMGDPIESSWFSMLFTLIVVVACEVVSMLDAIMFVVIKRSKYSVVYLVLILINAFIFMSMAYYSAIGTIICLSSYAILFVLRIINLVLNCIDVLKSSHKHS